MKKKNQIMFIICYLKFGGKQINMHQEVYFIQESDSKLKNPFFLSDEYERQYFCLVFCSKSIKNTAEKKSSLFVSKQLLWTELLGLGLQGALFTKSQSHKFKPFHTWISSAHFIVTHSLQFSWLVPYFPFCCCPQKLFCSKHSYFFPSLGWHSNLFITPCLYFFFFLMQKL